MNRIAGLVFWLATCGLSGGTEISDYRPCFGLCDEPHRIRPSIILRHFRLDTSLRYLVVDATTFETRIVAQDSSRRIDTTLHVLHKVLSGVPYFQALCRAAAPNLPIDPPDSFTGSDSALLELEMAQIRQGSTPQVFVRLSGTILTDTLKRSITRLGLIPCDSNSSPCPELPAPGVPDSQIQNSSLLQPAMIPDTLTTDQALALARDVLMRPPYSGRFILDSAVIESSVKEFSIFFKRTDWQTARPCTGLVTVDRVNKTAAFTPWE